MSLPLDSDGFLRRQCPYCDGEFKWRPDGEESVPSDDVEAAVYWCPRCGKSAAKDAWSTPAQREYAKQAAMGPALDQIRNDLKTSLRSLRFKPSHNQPPTPDPLIEPDDMDMVQPPCHPLEPLKIPSNSAAPHYCLICGSSFAT